MRPTVQRRFLDDLGLGMPGKKGGLTDLYMDLQGIGKTLVATAHEVNSQTPYFSKGAAIGPFEPSLWSGTVLCSKVHAFACCAVSTSMIHPCFWQKLHMDNLLVLGRFAWKNNGAIIF